MLSKEEIIKAQIKCPPKTKSIFKIGDEENINICVDTKFNKLQKFIWKFLLNIKIEDVED